MSQKEFESNVRLAKQDLDAALSAKQVAEKGLSDVQAAISDADELSTLSQKRKADAQGALNLGMADPKSTTEEIKLLRKSLKESETQQGDAMASVNAAKRALKQAGRACVEAADAVKTAETAHWRALWQQAAEAAREAADEHLRTAWAAGLKAKDFQPNQFDSLLKRTFSEPGETESRALAETMR